MKRSTRPVVISHDAFARVSLMRCIVPAKSGVTCQWCGKVRFNRTRGDYLYSYSTQGDGFGAKTIEIDHLYCSVSCMRAYNNE